MRCLELCFQLKVTFLYVPLPREYVYYQFKEKVCEITAVPQFLLPLRGLFMAPLDGGRLG
jgi:hypothetical protein